MLCKEHIQVSREIQNRHSLIHKTYFQMQQKWFLLWKMSTLSRIFKSSRHITVVRNGMWCRRRSSLEIMSPESLSPPGSGAIALDVQSTWQMLCSLLQHHSSVISGRNSSPRFSRTNFLEEDHDLDTADCGKQSMLCIYFCAQEHFSFLVY